MEGCFQDAATSVSPYLGVHLCEKPRLQDQTQLKQMVVRQGAAGSG